jgi:hypothetical protein
MTRNTTLVAALVASLLAITAARADFAEDASNHGFNSGAYELLCGSRLRVTDEKLRAQLDHKYRNTAQFRETYNTFYLRADIVARKGWSQATDVTCMIAAGKDAGKPHWLALVGPAKTESNTVTTTQDERVTDQKVAAYNQGYASYAVDNVCNNGGRPWLKADEKQQYAADQLFNNSSTVLSKQWAKGAGDAMEQYSAAYDREDGIAIDAICFKAAALPRLQGMHQWLDGSEFKGFYTQRCRETPGYYMCLARGQR